MPRTPRAATWAYNGRLGYFQQCIPDTSLLTSAFRLMYCKLAIILTRHIYNGFPKSTGLRVPKVTILTYSQRSIGQYMYRFLYNDFYFNDRFLLVNSLELALR